MKRTGLCIVLGVGIIGASVAGCGGVMPGATRPEPARNPLGISPTPFGRARVMQAPRGMKLDKFLGTMVFPKSRVKWQSGSASLGVEVYKVQDAHRMDWIVRLELSGPMKKGTSHGSEPWRIVSMLPSNAHAPNIAPY